jgi:hypothetical protein
MNAIPRPAPTGFALVVTLSLMILLTVIVVGLLALSSISLRNTGQAEHLSVARANARLALMLAMGELQKQLGPDQRISAKAEILDENPATEKIDGVAHPNYLGVWDSWNTWLTDKKLTDTNKSLAIQDTYQRGRAPSLFRAWLVSHPAAAKYETAPSAKETPDMVVLCGEKSAGTTTVAPVKASRIHLLSGTKTTGSYAWWIADESQKIRLDLNQGELKQRTGGNDLGSAQIIASHTGRPGIEKMTKMDRFDTTPDSLDKMVTTGQAGISAREAANHFHDLTAYSLGLLTDVRAGGFKSDLNLAFESDTLPAEMQETKLFSGRPYDAPIRPMTGEIGKIVPQNPYVAPMSWRQMREYYRLYRSDFSDSNLMQPATWSSGKPQTRRFLMGKTGGNNWDTKGYARQLVMLRQTWVLATKSEANTASPGGIDYYVLAIPVLYLWNPYNITMQVDSKEISSLGSMYFAVGMRQKTYRGTTLVSETEFPEKDLPGNPNANFDPTGRQFGYRMIPTAASGSAAIAFQAGEVRVFSTNTEVTRQASGPASGDAMLDRFFYATPGYTPLQDTSPGVLRGLKYRVNPGSGTEPLSFALRIADAEHCDNLYFGASRHSALVWHNQEVLGANNGAFYEDGSKASKEGEGGEWHDIARLGATSVDWLTPSEVSSAWVIRDDPARRAQWGAPGSAPMPVGIFSVVAKSAERLAYDSSNGFAEDFRNRSWLHAPPTRLANFLMNPVELNRANSPYQLHFRPVNGYQEVSEYLQADGPNGYFGGGYTPARGQTHLAPLNIPVAPIMNLGSFAGIRMDHARAQILQKNDGSSSPSVDKSGLDWSAYIHKHMGHAGAAFGAGIGNAYAHPMIDPKMVYTRNSFGIDLGWQNPSPSQATKLPVCDDYWDHLFLANEALWDSWFCSGITPEVKNGKVTTPQKTVAANFFAADTKKPTLVSQNFKPNLRGKSSAELAALSATTAKGKNGWESISSYLFNKGQFNVNSTSKEAWKALLLSLCDRPLAVADAKTGKLTVARDAKTAKVSRFPLANSEQEGAGPGDEIAWRGIRSLSEQQIDKLAEQIVRQVKLRGPFLNLAEFINRRLSTDPTGVTGALQAAIDWDEFNAGYGGTTSGSGNSINKAYKGGDDLITDSQLPAAYPNPKAATGSRYAGIPGYVMQSDLLQGIASSISVRGDTFLIRAYGESLLPDGKVAANAWCEAVFQRQPEYMDTQDDAERKMRLDDGTPAPQKHNDLQSLNQNFGRQFKMVAFRWLNSNEI